MRPGAVRAWAPVVLTTLRAEVEDPLTPPAAEILLLVGVVLGLAFVIATVAALVWAVRRTRRR